MKNKKEESRFRINSEIRAKEVKLVGENVTVGNYSLQDAIKFADQLGLDLVEINGSNPELSICRIVDFSKFLYEKKKNEKKCAKVEVKELRMRPVTDDNDLAFKLKHAREWLLKGDMVKASVFFKGREITHKDLGYQILNKVIADLLDIGVTERAPQFEGQRLQIMIKPRPKK